VDTKELREQLVRDAKRNLILDAARNVFTEKGFHETRLDDVAARAGFSKASLYNYYEDKETLFLSLGIREHCRMADELERAVDLTLSFDKNLEVILHIIVKELSEQFAFLTATVNFKSSFCVCTDASEKRDLLIGEFRNCVNRITQLFVKLVAAGKERGDIRTKLENSTLARYATSLLRGMLFEWRMAGQTGNIENEIHSVMDFIKKGFDLQGDSSGKDS